MNNIVYDDKIIILENNRYQYYKNFINRLNKRDCVKLTLFCTKTINDNNSKENNDCIELVEKWLVDEKSVTRESLYTAANAIWVIVPSAFNAANVANSIYAILVNDSAVYAATNIANAAYYINHINYATIDIVNKYL